MVRTRKEIWIVANTALIEQNLVLFIALCFQDFVRGVINDGLRGLSPVVVQHADFSHRELEGNVLLVKAYLHTDIVRDEVPVRVHLVVESNLSLDRVQDNLKRVQSQLEPHSREELTLGLGAPKLSSFSFIKCIDVFVFGTAQNFAFYAFFFLPAFLDQGKIFLVETCISHRFNRICDL